MTSPVRLAGKLGRLPHDPYRRALIIDSFLDFDAPRVTVPVDWLSLVTQWPMYGNDQYGDCVWAAIGHMIEAWTRYSHGVAIEVTTQALLTGYSATTGFNPNAPLVNGVNPTDNGTVIADALDYWLKVGIAGHKILAYAQVQDPTKIFAAMRVFGGMMIGVNFPQSAMDQFNAGKPWSVVRKSPIIGGHAVHVGYDGTEYKGITWAAVEGISDPWWKTYVEEAWVVITPEWLEASGRTPTGLNLQGLGMSFAALTNQPNPFPASTPLTLAPTVMPNQTLVSKLHKTWFTAMTWLKDKKV